MVVFGLGTWKIVVVVVVVDGILSHEKCKLHNLFLNYFQVLILVVQL